MNKSRVFVWFSVSDQTVFYFDFQPSLHSLMYADWVVSGLTPGIPDVECWRLQHNIIYCHAI